MEMSAQDRQRLVKKHLDYDGEDYRFHQGELCRVSSTHGASIDSVVGLLTAGKFSRCHSVVNQSNGKRDYNGEFYTTPNPKFDHAIDELEGEFDLEDWAQIDAIKAAIEYATSKDVKRATGFESLYTNDPYNRGAVITFSGRLSMEGSEISQDPMAYEHAESSMGVELVLPKPPELKAIRGIYPVDQESAEELRRQLPGFAAPKAA